MSLLTPLFLLGLIGIGLPIWLHRLQTQTNEREKFASSMFLEQTRHRIHVQRKLKYLLLLAARILFLTLLVLAFTRPIWELPAEALLGDADTHHVIVLDNSFSMQQGNHFDEAIDMARDIVNDMGSDDQASIFTASSHVTTIAEPTADTTILSSLLSGLEPDNGRLDLGAMVTALNTLIQSSQSNVEIHFISDYQRSGQPVRFADMIPDVVNGRTVSLSIERVTTDNEANWAITSVLAEGSEARVMVQGYNTDASNRTVQLSINGIEQNDITLSVPASGQQTFLFENLSFEEGDNQLDARIIDNDGLATDDQRFTVLDNSPPAPVLLLTNNPESLSITYISAALATAPRPYEAQVEIIDSLDTRILGRYAWVIIDDIGNINTSLSTAITNYINGGGSVFAAMGDLSEGLQTIPVSNHTLSGSLNLNQGKRLITSIDSSHPALQDSSGWATVNISQALPLEPNPEDTVLINLNNDVPLLIERSIGLGKLMLLNSSLDNTWTDLPLKPVFVGFMAETARYLSGEDILVREQVVDSSLQLQASGGASGQVYSPDGEALLALEDTTQAREITLSALGYYQVFTPTGEVLIAVNPDLRESDLTLMESQTLQNWQNTVSESSNSSAGVASTSLAANGEQVDAEQLELWRVLLILLVGIVLAESLLGNRHLRFNTDTSIDDDTVNKIDKASAAQSGAAT